MVGTKLAGRYFIKRHLGGGGFGQTYLAEDRQLPGSPLCVVKQLKPQSSDPETLHLARRLFDQEAQMLYSLGTHDRIPKLLAHVEENQEFYLVQEFIEGHTLASELSSGNRRGQSEVLELLRETLEILSFVHQQGVIHRDIKPANLMRRKSDGRIVLIDFGAVKQVSATAATAAAQSLTVAIGSAGYTATEQLAGRPQLSSDIYSVGIICIQALTGMTPDLLRQSSRTGELIWKEKAEVNPHLASFISRLVRYDFRQRFQSATEALQALMTITAPASSGALVMTPGADIPTAFGQPHSMMFDSGARTLAPTEVSPNYPFPPAYSAPGASAPQSGFERYKGPLMIAVIFILLTAAMGTVVWMKAEDRPAKPEKKETKSEPSPSPGDNPLSENEQAYKEGLARADEAKNMSLTATSAEQWEAVARKWDQAIESMRSVKEISPDYESAQVRIEEYRRQAQYAKMRAMVAAQITPPQTTSPSQPSSPSTSQTQPPPTIETPIMPPRLSERTYLSFNSYDISKGNSLRTFTTQNGFFDASTGHSGAHNGSINVSFKGPKDWFDLRLKAPGGGRLDRGTYENAQRYPFQDDGRASLDFSGNGAGGCNRLTGRFIIYDISYNSDGEIEMLDVAFERRCEGATQMIYGRLRYDRRDQK